MWCIVESFLLRVVKIKIREKWAPDCPLLNRVATSRTKGAPQLCPEPFADDTTQAQLVTRANSLFVRGASVLTKFPGRTQ